MVDRANMYILSRRGFTLVEMAIVLVIVGILVGLGVGMITPLTNMTRVRETKDNLDANALAITSWASANNRLPDSTSVPAANPVLFNNVAKTTSDAWGGPIVYLYDAKLAPGAVTKDTICGRRSTSLTVTTVAPAATISNVAFILLSGGGTPTPQSKLGGVVIAASGAAAGTITQDPAIGDILRWVTLDELRSKVGCQGAQLKIVNNELPTGVVAAPYPSVGTSVSISVDGGATPISLSWCIEAPGPAALPAGLVFNFAVPIRVAPNTCNGPANALLEGGWIAPPQPQPPLTITGTPTAGSQGSYNFTIFVRDNNDTAGSNDNITSKAFVMTINPQ